MLSCRGSPLIELHEFVGTERECDLAYPSAIGQHRIAGSHDNEVCPRELSLKPPPRRLAAAAVARDEEQGRANGSGPFSQRLESLERSEDIGGNARRPQQVTESTREALGFGDDRHPANLHGRNRLGRGSLGYGPACFTRRP